MHSDLRLIFVCCSPFQLVCQFCTFALASYWELHGLIFVYCPEFCAFISQFNQQFCGFWSVAFFFPYLFFYMNLTLCVYIYPRMKTFSLASSCTFEVFIFVRLSSAANQSNYVCIYFSVKLVEECFLSLPVTLNFWEFYLCPSC